MSADITAMFPKEIKYSILGGLDGVQLGQLMWGSIAFLFRLILVLTIGFICIKISKKAIDKVFATQKEKMPERKIKTLSVLFQNIAKYFIYFVMICEILAKFGVNMTSILAVTGVGSVAIGFGAQGLVKDFITGLYIIMEDQFGISDVVTINGYHGVVEEVGMRTTKIRGDDGSIHIIPNSAIGVVTNENK